MAQKDEPQAAAPVEAQVIESREPEEKKTSYFYPGDNETPSITVRAGSPEKAEELYKAKVKELKK